MPKGEVGGRESVALKAMLSTARESGFHGLWQLFTHLASFGQDRTKFRRVSNGL